jgi:hypothetical protein
LRSRAAAGGSALVGYFPGGLDPTSGISLGYRRFLKAAYDLLEPDPLRTAVGAVGVVLSADVAFQLHLNPSQPVRKRLHLRFEGAFYRKNAFFDLRFPSL